MDERTIQTITSLIGIFMGIAVGYGLGGWIEYRKGFETGIQTTLGLANSITITRKDE